MSSGLIELHTLVEDNDLVGIAEYIAKDDPVSAHRVLQAVKRTFELISHFPELGVIYKTDNPKLRSIRMVPVRPYRNYLVFYTLKSGNAGVRILYVLYGARDLDRVFREDARS